MTKKTGEAGKKLIKDFEGFRAVAYLCPAGVWTIGYGTTKINGKPVSKKTKITSQEADLFLEQDLKTFEDVVNHSVTVELNQNQFDALVSFVYNLGSGNLKKSTLLKKLNVGLFNEAADEFLKWDKAAGKRLAGLTRRRNAERELFLKKETKE
jgi:GH24 family phage-related lysozyme (muramidase)